MSNYTFSTINDKEFEELARDLLNAKFNLGLQSFKSGPDAGIDLRFSSPNNNNALVVQAKHYCRSPFSTLNRKLVSEELPKVSRLKPDRYLVVTSLPLSAPQKDLIRKNLAPFIHSSNDIFGREDLNEFLSDHPEVEKRHFKLWFSSINILETILNSGISGRTRYLLERIEKRIPYFVITQRLDDANSILEKKKLLLISGQPGIGKTTLAEIILMERVKLGYQIYQVESFREAEDVISLNPDDKQLFYVDDFLGDIQEMLVSANKTENEITRFIDRVINTPNKYLLLTSRTVFLSRAVEKFEKIKRSRLNDDRFELKLENYSEYQKAQILYNHLYSSNVPQKYCDAILEEQFYKTIIDHDNYSPRLIEFCTITRRPNKITKAEFRDFIEDHLDNPAEIWRHSFNNEIGYFERCLLFTLFTFAYNTTEENLLAAFQERLRYEKEQNNQVITVGQFIKSIRLLVDGFILSTRDDGRMQYRLINPSLADFILAELRESPDDLKAVIHSVRSSQQLFRFDPEAFRPGLKSDIQQILFTRFLRDEIDGLGILNPDEFYNDEVFERLSFLRRFCKDLNTDNVLLSYLEKVDFDDDLEGIQPILEFVSKRTSIFVSSYEFLKTRFPKIIEWLMANTVDEAEATEIPNLFQRFGHSFSSYARGFKGREDLTSLAMRMIRYRYEEINEEKHSQYTTIQEVQDDYYWAKASSEALIDKLKLDYRIVDKDTDLELSESDWHEKIEENLQREKAANQIDKHYTDNETSDADTAVDDLFSLLRKTNRTEKSQRIT